MMIYTYYLQENDFLTHQLFIDSKYKNSRKNRLRTSFTFAIIFLLLAVYFYLQENQDMMIYFLGVGLLSMIIFPFYLQWRYKKHYQKHVRRNFGASFGKKLFLEFSEEHIIGKDEDGSEMKINYSQIDAFHELPDHYFIKLNNGTAIVVPKVALSNHEEFQSEYKKVAKKLGLEIEDNTSWKWK
jgi:hypothetical protein